MMTGIITIMTMTGDPGGYNRNGDNNININVQNFNKISGQRLTDASRTGSTTRPIGKVCPADKPAQHALPLHQHGYGASAQHNKNQ